VIYYTYKGDENHRVALIVVLCNINLSCCGEYPRILLYYAWAFTVAYQYYFYRKDVIGVGDFSPVINVYWTIILFFVSFSIFMFDDK